MTVPLRSAGKRKQIMQIEEVNDLLELISLAMKLKPGEGLLFRWIAEGEFPYQTDTVRALSLITNAKGISGYDCQQLSSGQNMTVLWQIWRFDQPPSSFRLANS